jgi:hypothetical protein
MQYNIGKIIAVIAILFVLLTYIVGELVPDRSSIHSTREQAHQSDDDVPGRSC